MNIFGGPIGLMVSTGSNGILVIRFNVQVRYLLYVYIEIILNDFT